ncbi:hypothetical protein OH492_22550 [Vibrio chagasii]|nr:hypothetical protein [Vibrio chagasii]
MKLATGKTIEAGVIIHQQVLSGRAERIPDCGSRKLYNTNG